MVTVNGRPRDVADGMTVGALVAEALGASAGDGGADVPRGVAVALNGEVVPRASWEGTWVTAGDRVEVLTASQGG